MKIKKLKKVFMSFGVFVTGLISKVSAASAAPIEPRIIDAKYGVLEPTMGEKISSVGKFAISIILFIIGLFVILSKKINKKVKTIVISFLVIFVILGIILMNYLPTIF